MLHIMMRLHGGAMPTSYAYSTFEDVPAALRAARARFDHEDRLELIELSKDGRALCGISRDAATRRCMLNWNGAPPAP
ncbi:MAG: hypothetical protein AB7L65_07465, partial [Hyphomonadaceae bacterium]